MPIRLGANRVKRIKNGSNTIGNGFRELTRVYGGGPNGDTPLNPANLAPNILLDAYTANYTLIGGTEGTSNIIETISGTGLTLENIYAGDSAYEETAWCAAIFNDGPLGVQLPDSFFRIGDNGNTYFAPDYPCTNLTGNQNEMYGWDTAGAETLNIDVTDGFTAIVIARKRTSADEGTESLLSIGFDNNIPGADQNFLMLSDNSLNNQWYWNTNGAQTGNISAGFSAFDSSKFTFSAIATSIPNLSSGNFNNITLSNGSSFVTGGSLSGGGVNASAVVANNLVINRNYWESTYSVGVFTGKSWDIAAIMLWNKKLGNLQIGRIYDYYKFERGYDIY